MTWEAGAHSVVDARRTMYAKGCVVGEDAMRAIAFGLKRNRCHLVRHRDQTGLCAMSGRRDWPRCLVTQRFPLALRDDAAYERRCRMCFGGSDLP